MPKTLIKQLPDQAREERSDGSMSLKIAEMFCDTIQGEGINSGVPSTFIRLQGCTLVCVWCDTLDVWKHGNPYSIEEIFDMFEQHGMIEKFKNGQHIIFTGGSPLKQQIALLQFCRRFGARYDFLPHYEVENECVLEPNEDLVRFISTWNNSPKLANSGMKERARYKPDIIKKTAQFKNSWFKFVVDCEEDWEEINEFFIQTNLVSKDQIILMPEGEDQEKLNKTREVAADMAIKHNVRFCDRQHVTIWNKKTGV